MLGIRKFLGVVCCLVAAGGIAQAATIDLDAGEFVCEGPNALLPGEFECNEDNTFGDGGQSSGPTVNLTFSGSGSATIYGGVRGQSATLYADVFDLMGTGKYNITLSSIRFTDPNGNVLDPVAPFDATWTVGGVEVGTINNQINPAILSLSTMINFSGQPITFNLDASGGFTDRNIMEYRVDITAVPLPAGGMLLLTGLGGLVLARRRIKA